MPINYAEYPPDWDIIRERILKRANNCCEGENCGLKNHSIIKREKNGSFRYPCQTDWDMIHSRIKYSKTTMGESLKYHGFTKIILTIAHLDHDKWNWEVTDDRLKALCQRCHLKYDLPRHIANRKYGRNHKLNQHTLNL